MQMQACTQVQLGLTQPRIELGDLTAVTQLRSLSVHFLDFCLRFDLGSLNQLHHLHLGQYWQTVLPFSLQLPHLLQLSLQFTENFDYGLPCLRHCSTLGAVTLRNVAEELDLKALLDVASLKKISSDHQRIGGQLI